MRIAMTPSADGARACSIDKPPAGTSLVGMNALSDYAHHRRRDETRLLRTVILAGVFAGTAAWAGSEQGAKPAPKSGTETEGVIDPKADAALHRMSDYLAGLKSFRVDTTVVDEKITTEGQKIQELKESKIALKRPGELRVDRFGPNGHAVFRDDGKQFSLYNADKNVYAEAPAPAGLDAAIDDARDRLNVEAPGADLLVSNPYAELIDGVTVGRYIGLEPIGSVKAHHLAVTKDNVDYQIWIQDGPQPVPLRYVITSKDMTGQPQFTIEFRNWQANAPISDDTFAFTPPAGAKRVDPTAPKSAER